MGLFGNKFKNKDKVKKEELTDEQWEYLLPKLTDYIKKHKIIDNINKSIKKFNASKYISASKADDGYYYGYNCNIEVMSADIFDFRSIEMKEYNVRDVEVSDELLSICDKIISDVKEKIDLDDGVKLTFDDGGDWDDMSCIVSFSSSFIKQLLDEDK